MFRGFSALLLLIVAVAGLCAFSLYAHDRVSESQVTQLQDEVAQLQQQNEQLQNQYTAQGKRFTRDRNNWEDTLYVMFPGQENRQRIHTLFHVETEEEANVEEGAVGDDGPVPTEVEDESVEAISEEN